MESSEFVKKFKSWYLWKNLLAMAAVVIALCLGVKFGLDVYTHHGQSIPIPNIKHKLFSEFNVHTIIRLPPSVFAPYSNIKTNILFFENTHPTRETWFYRVDMPKGYNRFTKRKPLL